MNNITKLQEKELLKFVEDSGAKGPPEGVNRVLWGKEQFSFWNELFKEGYVEDTFENLMLTGHLDNMKPFLQAWAEIGHAFRRMFHQGELALDEIKALFVLIEKEIKKNIWKILGIESPIKNQSFK